MEIASPSSSSSSTSEAEVEVAEEGIALLTLSEN
jgi:hypothetical protein